MPGPKDATTLVWIDVGPNGKIQNATIYKSSANMMLDRGALEAARSSSYVPMTVDCQPTKGLIFFATDFTNPPEALVLTTDDIVRVQGQADVAILQRLQSATSKPIAEVLVFYSPGPPDFKTVRRFTQLYQSSGDKELDKLALDAADKQPFAKGIHLVVMTYAPVK